MPLPIKISDRLWALAKEEAEGTHRSMTAQIEHWASLGRAVEVMASYRDVLALKRAGEALRIPTYVPREDVHATLKGLVENPGRDAVKARIRASKMPIYTTDARYPGRIVEIAADGTRAPGHVEGRRFIADAEERSNESYDPPLESDVAPAVPSRRSTTELSQLIRNTKKRPADHRARLLRNLLVTLFRHDRVTTTETKARPLRGLADACIRRAITGEPHARRQLGGLIADRDVVDRLFQTIAPRYVHGEKSYTRIISAGRRRGGGAMLVVLEVVSRPETGREDRTKTKPGRRAVPSGE